MTKSDYIAAHPEIAASIQAEAARRKAYNRALLKRFPIWFALAITVTSGPLILALLVKPWSMLLAQVVANGWLVLLVVVITMKRPPALYGSYGEWWRDRANWWVGA